MKTNRMTKAQVMKRVRYWRHRLALDHVDFTVEFGRDPEKDSNASCFAQPEYEEALLRFDMDVIPEEKLEDHIIHEMTHYPVWPLSSFAHTLCDGDAKLLETLRKLEEGLTTYIAKRFQAMDKKP